MRTKTSLGIEWEPLRSTDDVTYEVQVYDENSNVPRKIDNLRDTYYEHSTVAGRVYTFTVTARTICGPSLPSLELTLTAGVEPDRPSVRLDIDREEFAHCHWEEPNDNGFRILGYYVDVF